MPCFCQKSVMIMMAVYCCQSIMMMMVMMMMMMVMMIEVALVVTHSVTRAHRTVEQHTSELSATTSVPTCCSKGHISSELDSVEVL